jgi:hypothetical protein
MATIRTVIGKLATRLFGLFGWRGQRALLWLRDRLDTLRARGSRFPAQPWRLATDFPAGTHILATIEPPPASTVVQPAFHGRVQLPLIGGGPFERMHVLPRSLRRVPDALVMPGQVAVDATTGRVVPYPMMAGESHPHNGLRVWPDGKLSFTHPLRRRTAVSFEQPVFLADTSHHIYGHVLLEVLPRLLFLDHCPPDTLVLTGVKMQPPYPEMFAAMGVDPARIVSLETPAWCREAYLADNFVDLRNFVAPQAWEAFARLARLGERSTVPTAERLYVSRRGIRRRALVNEAEVEALFARRGFTIVNPEALSFADQVRLFAHASVIAGPGGSALHDMVFSRPDTRVLILAIDGLVLPIDTLLTREPGALTYVLGSSTDSTRLYLAPWSIDPDEVEAAIDRIIG